MSAGLSALEHLVVKRSIAKEKTECSFSAEIAGGVVEGSRALFQVVRDKHVQGEHQAKGLERGEDYTLEENIALNHL